jgi:maltose alpha-D-glucosyltransferase/alpha-amylase
MPEEPAAVPALFAGVVWDSILDGSMRQIIERQALVPFLQRQRWFGGKARAVAAARLVDWTALRRGAHPAFVAIVEAEYKDGGRERYVVPLAMASGAEAEAVEQQHAAAVVARITGARKGVLYDGIFDDGTCTALLAMMREPRELPTRGGRLSASGDGDTIAAIPPANLAPITRSAPDQSNTSILFARRLIMKIFRRVEAGLNPDVEIGAFLRTRGFTRVPPLAGSIGYTAAGQDEASVAMLQEFVPNQGNGWDVTIEELRRYFERVAGMTPPPLDRDQVTAAVAAPDAPMPEVIQEAIGSYLLTADTLGRRTGELHLHLAGGDPGSGFERQAFGPAEIKAAAESMRRRAEEQLDGLAQALPRLDERHRELAATLIASRDELLQQFRQLAALRSGGARIRTHGDYHLGQILVSEGDVVILDFEGEPARPLAERRARYSPLRDVAGMIRSFSYAAMTGLGAVTQTRPDDLERLAPWAAAWETWVSAAFLRTYLAATRGTPLLPSDPNDMDVLLQALVLDKAMYELGYELNNRPDWIRIPLVSLLRLRSRLHA